MKKLMIAAAVIAMGFAAQANAVKWGVMQVKPSSGDTATTGYTGYLFVSGDTSGTFKTYTLAAITEALSAGDTSVLDNAISSANASSIVTTGSNAGNANWSTVTAPASVDMPTGNTLSGFLIIVDDQEANYLVALSSGEAIYSKTIGSGTGAYQMSFGTQASNTAWQTIPEPTSGLLLLLGVAGLALRRRRA